MLHSITLATKSIALGFPSLPPRLSPDSPLQNPCKTRENPRKTLTCKTQKPANPLHLNHLHFRPRPQTFSRHPRCTKMPENARFYQNAKLNLPAFTPPPPRQNNSTVHDP